MSDYLVETSDGVGLVFTASTDMEACVIATEQLLAKGLYQTGLNLFRYPLYWVDQPKGVRGRCAGLIWVPLFRFIEAQATAEALNQPVTSKARYETQAVAPDLGLCGSDRQSPSRRGN